jgi:hypothetical protein
MKSICVKFAFYVVSKGYPLCAALLSLDAIELEFAVWLWLDADPLYRIEQVSDALAVGW